MNAKLATSISWIAQLFAVVIMGQTLLFKFGGAEESRILFTELDMEPNGRILIGVLELIACILLLLPSSIVYGALLGAGLMAGAVIGHITTLGWEGDRLSLGLLAIATMASCLLVLYIRRRKLPFISAAIKNMEDVK